MRKTILITSILFFTFLISCHVFKTDGKENKTMPINNNERINNFHIQKKDSYLISFYNTENLFDTIDDPNTEDEDFTPEGYKKWTKERYLKKLKDLSFVLSILDSAQLPSVIGLCEVENRTVCEELAKQELLKKAGYKIVHEESPDARGIDVALLYNPTHFEYYSHKSIKVKIPEAPEALLRDILYVKGAFYKSDTFHIFINHWKSRRPDQKETEFKRVETAKILRKEIDSILITNNNANIIIMGDFNDEPDNKSILKILTCSEKNDYNKLYNLMTELDNNGKGTNSRNYEWFMLDNMIVSQSLIDNKDYFVKDRKGMIFNDKRILYYNAKANFHTPNKTYGGKNYYGGFSDHLPVYFYLNRN